MKNYDYTAKDIDEMRDCCYGISHKLIDRYGDYFDKEEFAAVKIRVWIELTESVLQSYLVAGVTPEELRKHVAEHYSD